MATAAREGNVLNPPGTTSTPGSTAVEVLASHVGHTQKGVTLKQVATGATVLETGCILERDSATKRYIRCTTAANARGFLRKGVDVSPHDRQGNIVFKGILFYNVVLTAMGGDAAAVTLVAAAVTALGGRIDLERNYIII
jgi:hypothetical protein